MALKTFVKVSGVNNLSDTRYCAGMGVSQLGFNIESSHPNYTDPQSFKELSDWVSGVKFVGEIESLDSQGKLAELISEFEIDVIQVSHIALIDEAIQTGKEVVFYTNDLGDAEKAIDIYGDKLAYLLLENEQCQLNQLSDLSKKTQLVLGSGFDAHNLDEVLKKIAPKGIALKGGDEIRPGYKDFDTMADILEALDADEWS